MTRLHIIRHAAFDGVGRILAGRSAAVRLNDVGRAQAVQLARRFAAERIAAVYSSPLERAMETASTIAAEHDFEPLPHNHFNEIDFGEWTGRTVESLHGAPGWEDFNLHRSVAGIPGGEHMLEVQARVVRGFLEVAHQHTDETVIVVTHADVVRALLGHLLGLPMDHLLRLEIAPASFSTIELHGAWPRVLCIGSRL